MSKQFKRILALIMALALCVSLLPGVALAEAPDEDQDEIVLIDPEDEEPAEPEDEITIVDPAEDEPEDPLPPPEKEKEEETRSVQPPVELGDISDYPEITAGEPQQVDISTPGQYAYFRFTPTETKVYQYYSSSVEGSEYKDTYGYLFDADMNQIASDDDNGEDNNFYIDALLEAGVTYVLGSRFYNTSNGVGSYLVTVEEAGTDYFRAYADGSSSFNVEYGGSCTMSVIAITNNEVTYRWRLDDSEDFIEGAEAASFTLENITERHDVYCVVSDDQGHSITIQFYINIDSHLSAHVKGSDYSYVYLNPTPGDTVLMEVEASCDVGDLHYAWSTNWTEIEDPKTDSFTLENVTANETFYCRVSDDFGNYVTVYFYINLDNGFYAYADEEHTSSTVSKYVPYENSVEMYVYAGCTVGELHYKWYDNNWDQIEDATDPLCTVGPITERTTFFCQVSDDYGSNATVTFYVYVDSGLYAYCGGTDGETSADLTYIPGNDLTLEAVAGVNDGSGEVHYQWYRTDSWQKLEGETNAQYAVTDITGYRSYRCDVSDDFGNIIQLYYYIDVDNSFYARVAGTESSTSTTLRREPHTSFDLEVDAGCTAGDIHYQWYNYSSGILEGQTSSVFSITDFIARDTYYCRVSDDFGSVRNVYFYLYVENGLTAYVAGTETTSTEKYYEPHSSFTLQVDASCTAGEIHYQWYNYSSGELQGENDSSITVTDFVSYDTYYCYVTDDFGNTRSVYFYLHVENGFYAYADAENERSYLYIYVSPEASFTMQVVASCNQGDLHYRWTDNNWNEISGADGPSFTVENGITSAVNYHCTVSDDYGSSNDLTFYCRIQNHLTAYIAGTQGDTWLSTPISPNTPFTMAVEADCDAGDIHYEWRDGNWNVIEGAAGPEYTVENGIIRSASYYCIVTDDYGSEVEVEFYYYIQNHLQAYIYGTQRTDEELQVNVGDDVELKVEASCDDGELHYQWSDNWTDIEGANTSSYTLENVSRYHTISCRVSDDYGSYEYLTFYIYIDSGLYAYAAGTTLNDVYYYVDAGSSIDLAVDAGVKEGAGAVHYVWYKGSSYGSMSVVEGADGPVLPVAEVTGSTRYQCTVTDDYEAEKHVTFRLEAVDTFSARPVGESTKYVKYGNPVTLKVLASTGFGEPHYQWLLIKDGQSITLEGETANTFTSDAILEQTDYVCVVTDDGDNWGNVYYTICIDSGLAAAADSSSYFQIEPGDSVTMSVSATVDAGEIHYQWFCNGDEISGANEAVYTAENISSYTSFYCRVTDDYGNVLLIYFEVYVGGGSGGEDPIPPLDEIPELTLLEFSTAEITQPNTLAYFRFTPAVTKMYRFYSDCDDDTYGYLYDADHRLLSSDDDSGRDGNFMISCQLTAGQTYILGVRFYDRSRTGSFPVTVDEEFFTASPDGNNSFSVAPGGSVTMKVKAESSGTISYAWYDSRWIAIPDATESSLTVTDIQKETQYCCKVSDSNGNSRNVWFYITIDSHLTASADGDTVVYVDYNGSCTLGVKASVDSGALHYRWFRDSDTSHLVPGGSGATYTLSNVVSFRRLGCIVSDDFGNSRTVNFEVVVNSGLTAGIDGTSDMNRTYSITPGSDLTLKVTASVTAGDVNYQWYRHLNNSSCALGNQSADPSALELKNIQKAATYTCEVSDDFGHLITLYFYVRLENGFSATADGPSRFTVEPGASVTMKVKAEADAGDIHYQWYETSGYYSTIIGATSDTLTVSNVQEAKYYECKVWDDYGNTDYVYFQIGIENDFSAYADGPRQIKIESGSDVTMKVTAHVNSGEIHYQWFDSTYEYQTLASEVDTLTLTNVTAYRRINCSVWDDYGNNQTITFQISIENGFTAYVKGTKSNWADVYAAYGGSVKLEVEATANQGGITYEWYDNNWNLLQGASQASFDLTNVTRYQQIHCYVRDEYGNNETIYFEVYVQNDFHAYAKGTTYTYQRTSVDYNGSTTLEVDVTAADLSGLSSYWQELILRPDGYTEYVRIEGATGYALTIGNITESRRFRFYCTDKYGNPASVEFEVNVNNNFKVYANDSNSSYVELRIPNNSSAALTVRAEADRMDNMRYRWYYYEIDENGYSMNYTELPGQTGPNLTTPKLSGAFYFLCEVTDYYGTSLYAQFRITASDYKLSQNYAEIPANKTLQLKMTDSSGKTVNATWSSSNPDAATVDQNGLVTAKKYGWTLIRAIAPDGTYDNCEIMTLFSDVTKTSQYYFNPVYWAAENGITVGYNDGSFGVGQNCKRRDLMIFLWRYAGCPGDTGSGSTYGDARTMFNDLKSFGPSTATNKAIAWAYKTGITKGYDDGGFHPDHPIVRKDVMILLYRLAGKPAVSGTLSFPDCKSYKPGTDTYNAILWGSKNKITKGYEDGTFGPTLNCLREQIVTFLYRYNNLSH